MAKTIILIGIGGFIGSVCRFLVVLMMARTFPVSFPLGTFTVNLVGCFLMGMIAGQAERLPGLSPDLRMFLTVGFCGGFTTYSAFAFENVAMMIDKNFMLFAFYSAATYIFCLTAACLGLIITRS